ncbi:beta-lactamase superfamily domain-containing protein [Myxozyma melibiosi]|uniref:Beta-lactamase superfamily domain-containing protein n=1 Tax=Myxozyma melibiosi TaxID=54550 RepID=A0ABR1F879_9ASCO
MGIKIKVVLGLATIYTTYNSCLVGARLYEIRQRRIRAEKAVESGDLEALELHASPEKQFGVLVIAGRFANPFREYREQGVLDFFFWRIVEILKYRPWHPRGGVPRLISQREQMLPTFTPDYEDPQPIHQPHLHSPTVEVPSCNERLTVTWIGQSCMFVQCNGINFLTDPVFGDYLISAYLGPKRIIPSPCSIDSLPHADFVLVSHNHPDHFEDETIKKIGNSALWIVGLGVRPFLARRGIFRVVELKWWDKISLPAIAGKDTKGWEIACTPAMHWSGRGFFDANASLWCSFMILHNSKPVVFHCGDTGYSPDIFTSIEKVYGSGCELALMPIGAYEPRAHLRPLHCNPEEAVQMMIDVGARRLVGVHWGTFVLSDEHFLEPKIRLHEAGAKVGLGDAVWGAEFGRTIVIPYRGGAINTLLKDSSDSESENAFSLAVAKMEIVGPMRPVEGRDTMVW